MKAAQTTSAARPGGRPGSRPEGLRERKKRLTRKAIFDTARQLFGERGFDNVTVAEIADAANVSVKTLFSYVRSKEELLFTDEPNVLDEVVAAVRGRRVGQTPLVAAATALLAAVDEPSPARNLDGFRRMAGESPAARARLRVLWEEAEDAVTQALSGRRDGVRERAARRLGIARAVRPPAPPAPRPAPRPGSRRRTGRRAPPTGAGGEGGALLDGDDQSRKRGEEGLREWNRDAPGSLARGLQAPGR